jgi:hypothetical protein
MGCGEKLINVDAKRRWEPIVLTFMGFRRLKPHHVDVVIIISATMSMSSSSSSSPPLGVGLESSRLAGGVA